MLLAFDIGNTNVGCALFEGERIIARRRFKTDSDQVSFSEVIKELVGGTELPRPDAVMASSVVSGMIGKIGKALEELWELALVEVDSSMDLGVEVNVPCPEAVGIDRLVAAGEAYRVSCRSVLVVSVGTAITVDLVSEAGCFIGGTICLGLQSALWALAERTSFLPEVCLTEPPEVLGQDTPGCIRSGVVYGGAGAVDRLINELSLLSEETPQVFLTGGDASFLSPYLGSTHSVIPDLVLQGLASTYLRSKK